MKDWDVNHLLKGHISSASNTEELEQKEKVNQLH